MNTKQKLAYIAIGGLLVATGMIISPLNAQKDKFGDIECESLKVTGVLQIVGLPGGGGSTIMTGGAIILSNFPQKHNMKIGTNDKYGGYILIHDLEANRNNVDIGVDEHGGYVAIKGRSKGSAIMGINKKGNGAMSTYDKNGYIQ